MRASFNNQADNATLTASSELGRQYIDNIIVKQLDKTFSFDGNSGNIVIDFGSATQIKSIVLGNINITSGTGSLTIQANAIDSWGAPSYSQTITIQSNTKNQVLYLDETYQYFRVVTSDSSLTNLSIGYLFMGDYLQLPSVEAVFDEAHFSNDRINITNSRQVYSTRFKPHQEKDFTIPSLSENAITNGDGTILATKAQMLAFWDDVRNSTPFFIVPFEESLTLYAPLFIVLRVNNLKMRRAQDFTYELPFNYGEVR